MKKQTAVAFVLLLLIPVVCIVGGLLFSWINPEIAAGHPNYVRNYHYLSLVKIALLWATGLMVVILWLLVCFLVIRSKQRSLWWLLWAPLGPFGFAILAMLRYRDPEEADSYTRFVRGLNRYSRVGYEVCAFVIIWTLAYEAMVLKRFLMIQYQSATTGMSPAKIIDLQNASSGMWAFAEGNEVMFMVVLLYLIRPFIFNMSARVTAMLATPNAS